MTSLGDRIKEDFENRTRFYLPRKTYTIIRADGKAFGSYTRKFKKPFDDGMNIDMAYAALGLCEEISGSIFAYTQSDEISILVTDFAKANTGAWFNGNLQKTVSVAAGRASSSYNESRLNRLWKAADEELTLEAMSNLAVFDARAFTMATAQDVEDYFVWRQMDCIRNSISMAARGSFSHNQLLNKSTKEMKEMLKEVGKPWEDYSDRVKFGAVVSKVEEISDITFTKSDGEVVVKPNVARKRWQINASPVFRVEREFLKETVPRRE
jgi:tRNA(His) 5'-end guanylyltransferase